MQGAGGPCAVLAPLQAFLLKVHHMAMNSVSCSGNTFCQSYFFGPGKPGEGHLELGQLGEGDSEGSHGACHGGGNDGDDLFAYSC